MAEKEEEKANTEEVSPEEPSGPLPDAEETDNSSSKTPEPRVPRLVLNGLKLKQKSQKLPFRAFDYTPAINYSADLGPTDWHLLSVYDIVGDHIRVHELREGDNLLECAKEYRESHAQAMIVINSTEDSSLLSELSRPLRELESFLVAILPHSDGIALLDCLQVQFEDDELFAKLDVFGSEATPLTVLGEDDDTAVYEGTEGIEMNTKSVSSQARGESKGFNFKLFSGRSNVFDLKAEIKKVMFDGDNMLPVSSDSGLFTIIMATFSQYEKIGKHELSQVNELLRRFNLYLVSSFHFEFPFFLVLVYRLRKFRKCYECDELGPFITKCIEMFEVLTPNQVSDGLKLFLEKKDFDVMFGQEEANTSAFTLLATACRELMHVSTQIKSSRPSIISSKRLLYCKLLWISVYLKCVGEKGTVTRHELAIWDNSLLKTSAKIPIKKETIEDLRLGLEVSALLNLPAEHQFTIHHLAQFLANEKFIRPLSHVRDVITALEDFIRTDRELLVHVMINLRAHYTGFVQSSTTSFVKQASVGQTVLGTLDEGITFLDSMTELWNKKRWNKGEQHNDFRAECLKWMMLLLGIVRMTDPNASQLLKKFLAPKRGSVIADKDFRSHIVQVILEETRKSFPNLTIQLFFPLYKAYRIWPIPFLHDFLKQYNISNTIRINDATWSEFFSVVLERFQNEEPQNHLLEFLVRVADVYRKDRRAGDFIPDVLQLKVSQLFSADTEAGLNGESVVGEKFSEFLKVYIQRNNLRPELMSRIQEIIGYVPENEPTAFHWIVLNVLQTEVIPELKSLQEDDKQSTKQFKDLLKLAVNTICKKVNWFGPLSPRQKFCWGVVAAGCSKIPVTAESFEWIFNLQAIINQLGVVFNTYRNSRKLFGQACLLTDIMPQEIQSCPWDDVRSYFNWVRSLQDLLCIWQNRFFKNTLNYDEILMYASNNVPINTLGQAVCAGTYVMEMQDVSEVKKTFTICFEQLNCYLLRYVPDHPEVKYCTLPELLHCYGVSFPPELQETLQHKIIFPGNEMEVPDEQKLKNIISPSPNNAFNPGHNISLMVTKSLSLYDLQKILDDLQIFLDPIIDHIEMFVFFHLHKSEMFTKHLLKRLNDISTASSPNKPERTFLNLPSSIRPSLTFTRSVVRQAKDEGIPIKVLQRALDGVKDLLLKFVKGTATYSDIVADGTINLETLKTEEEFAILTKFSDSLEMNRDNCEGLDGIKSMLDLFQIIYNIGQIKEVCEQYGLEKCMKDERLQKMLVIAEELKVEQSRAKLTPIDAKLKMTYVKEALCLAHHSKYSCLDVFPAVANSAAFYQFIRDKQFVGSKGQEIFREQYQLITAQLQHEEYDENVLNHLRVAYEFIAPFMETDISFSDLMGKVTKLDVTHGLKQLETVNENITLIRLWFSRAEGDTIENVAKELQHILSTGIYQFQLNGDSNILLIYQTMQNMRAQRKGAPNGAPLEDSGEVPGGPKGMPTLPTVFPSPLITPFKKDEGPFSNTMGSVEQRWNSEQIADFVRKLGFLDTKKEGGDMIRKFLHLNSTANKLLELFMKLFELGHPHYQKYRNLPILLCSTQTQEANAMVEETQKTLFEWRNQVASLRLKYPWLLFFSVPKALHLYSLLEEVFEPDLDSVVLEVSFLFENSKAVRDSLKFVVKNAIQEVQSKKIEATPMEFLGEFLHLICGSPELDVFLCKERSTRRSSSASRLTTQLSITSPTASGAPIGSYQLHYTPGYSQSQIICLITDLYKGVPECFEVFHCRPSTTKEELHLFMERIKHHPLPYLVLEVNKLSFSLQELLMTLLKRSRIEEDHQNSSSVHFIETSPSVLREVPWITYREYKENGPIRSLEEAGRMCRRLVVNSADFTCIQLVYGHAGDGKTHYIRQQLAKSPASLTVAVNEAFTPLYAIKSLNQIPQNIIGCAVFFNFTLMPYQKIHDETEREKAKKLTETIGWFFYHLLVLGYVEDPSTGASFRFPGGQEWAIYVEVPSLDRNHRPEESLQLFTKIFPTLGLLGSTHPIYQVTPFTVDEDVQLVCKYLKAYKIGGVKGIDRLYREGGNLPGYVQNAPNINKKVKFSEDPDLSDEECQHLLTEYMPDHIQETKITQKLFIRYMKRRCAFLDDLPAFNYNTGAGEILFDETAGKKVKTDTRQLGSTLMQTMLEEVGNFCDPDIKRNWGDKPHQQLIYDFRDGGGSFGLLSLQLEKMPEARLKEYSKIGFELHPSSKLQNREILDQWLARALGLPSEIGKRLAVIDDCNYVLTLDYTIKMLNIHERYSCGVPVIIKGETGVGKTALVEMLSRLWSNALLHLWNKERGTIIDTIRDLMSIRVEDSLENYQTCLEIVEAITTGRDVSVQDLVILGQLNDRDPSKGNFYNRLRELLLDMENNPAIALLKLPSTAKGQEPPLPAMFELARKDTSSETTATLLQAVLRAKIRNTFHKLNVHAALTPNDIKTFFEPVFEQANLLKKAYLSADENKKNKIKMPFITVFLDEVNTSSCLGLFKEIIVDKTLDGKPIPENVFIVAACNPHRGNSMATHAAETWLRSSYYVRPLHPTLEYLMWDYGSLDQYQERDYIRAKMQMLHKELPNIEVVTLTDLIVESQSLMRRYALRQLANQKMKPEEAEISSKSCVSQRDIQRVFTFYQWLMSVYGKLKHHGEDRVDYSRRAVMVSLGIVYYMRLNSQYRTEYEEVLNRKVSLPGEVSFSEAFNEELDFFCKSIELPPGIAKTRALKENLFATIVCTVTHTPLIIVGAPGSSKTLSFNLAIANLKGPESKMQLFRDIRIFKSLDPHFYQCSRRTTSNEVQTVFSRAINRQRSHAKFSLPIYCVVFMDEAGLPEESHESLKVLHYHLDKQEVSFVAITNHVLDAAKTNRAVSLFRPEVSNEDLKTLAKGCLTPNPEKPSAHLRQDLDTIVRFCPAYTRLMEDQQFNRFFGLRDFIHFINYLRRRRGEGITAQLVMEALERNFNGVYWSNKHDIFQAICESFLKTMDPSVESKPVSVRWRSILEVLKESLGDRPEGNRDENEVRYKLVIDPTEDNSLMHLLIAFGVLDRQKTRIYVCSDFPGDSQIQKINTIAAIRHSAIEGHTVVMSQTDDIHESFYDLFNQRFRRIDDPEHGPRYYANIAIGAHLRPCRVHPDFACVVVVKQSEVNSTPAPFLNRFEKYCISHETLLSTALSHLQPCVRIILQTAREKVNEFTSVIGRDNSSVYGLKPETLDSLILSLLPPYGHTYNESAPGEPISEDTRICLLHELLRALRSSAGFAVPACPFDELVMDADHLFPLVLDNDPTFEGAMDSLTIETANAAVNEAMNVLHTAPNPSEEGVVCQEMSQEACLVVSILQQWLIRHFCKTLMQLMTPEAICLHRKKIPASLIDNYLTNQQHFSLKKLIKHHLLALESRQNNTYLCPNKLLCFTRSSSVIHHLPTIYPHPGALKRGVSDDKDTTLLKELIHDDLTHIQVCQVLSVQSQTAIQETLRNFIQEAEKRMLLLLVNMQEATVEMVNHLRVMIGEAETQAPPDSDKLFVLLLHFPPTMFFDPCYPSLFLRGWNHYYLDSIGHSPTLHSGKLDIEEWFQRCCFSNKDFEGDNLFEACSHLLKEVIPALASHITYGTRSTGPFTRMMKAAERSEKLNKLLFVKGVGTKLCQMFKDCWRPNMMIEYLEIAAGFTRSRESSLNITDAIQSMFQSLFTNFMIVMITRMNAERNLDVLFSEDNCSEVEKLFLSLLETMKPPKLDQLKTLAGSLAQPQPLEYQPRFPFFSMVNKSMEQLIEDSRKIKGNQDNLLDENAEEESPTVSQSGRMDSGIADLAELIFTTIDERIKEEGITPSDPLFITLKHIKVHPEKLWDRYFSDFIYHSLHMDIVTSTLSREVISAFFSDLLQLPPVQRLVYLHIYVDFNRINLANICLLLRPLEEIWMVAADSPHALGTGGLSPANDFIKAVRETKHPFGDPQMMSTFVISALFSALVGAIFPQDKNKDQEVKNGVLRMWYQTYQGVMSMPALRSHLYVTPLPRNEEAKFNAMHATYALIHIYPEIDEDVLVKGHNLFATLLQRYFKTNLQLKDPEMVPSLASCLDVGGEMIFDEGNNSITQGLSRTLQEELFNHFLSPYRPSYSSQDRDWFLRQANCQYIWKASTQLVNETIISSSYSEDLLGAVEKSLNRLKPRVPLGKKPSDVSMATYKRYLSLVLGCHSKQTEDQPTPTDLGPLMMYNAEARRNVADVLSDMEDAEEPGPYIPTFYQDCRSIRPTKNSENLLMQQPLCHLYFATLLEHLMTEPRDMNSLVRLTGTLSQLSRPQSVPKGDKILLQIEKQAVTQCLLRQLATLFSDNTNQVLVTEELNPIINELNELLNDDGTGGGAVGGHRLVLGMHLLHKLRSHRRFTELFTTRYPIIKAIQCTSVFHEQLKVDKVESKPHLFPFMCIEDQQTSPLSRLYQQVKTAMLNVDASKGSQASIDQLLKVANECAHQKSKSHDRLDKRQAFKMILWLVTYYEFFAKKKSSQALSLVVGQQLKQYVKDDGVIRLLQSFLHTKWLIEKKESPMPLREDAQMLKVLPDGRTVRVEHGGEKADPLYNLFVPDRLSPRDQSDDDLCHCMANLVGVVLGCQPQSNHLWYHMFAPDELKDTYMTGFMYDAKISPEGLLYDCGVELTPDGQYGRPDYLPHATRGTYSLHSLYFLLWANFGTFCVSMLTQPHSQSKIHGSIISEWQAIRHYCVSQVKTLWMHLRNNLSLSDEERSFLVTRCLMTLYETNMESTETALGKLKTKDELNDYETFWHEKVFTPAWQELHDKFEDYSVLWQNKLFVNIRHLEACYPQYPSERDFLNYIQGLKVDDGGWKLLARFAVGKQRLEVGGELLPGLIRLYQWLHTYLAHLVTPERAYNKLNIGRVIQLASRRVDPTIRELYQNVKGLYNKYVELVGGAIGQGACAAVRRGNRIYTIEDDLPLIHFLSDSKEEGEGNDWLYAVIQDIANTQNDFIHTLYVNMSSEETGERPLSRLLPQDPPKIYLTEANEHSCLVGKEKLHRGLCEYLWLVRARLDPPVAYRVEGAPVNGQEKAMSLAINKMVPRPSLCFSLTRLQEDVVSHYLSGKPIIRDISSLRTVFKFKQDKKSVDTKGLDSDPMGAASDITALGNALPQDYQMPVESNHSRLLEYEFHSANYQTLTDIVIGLRTAVGLLVKVLNQDTSISVQRLDKLSLHEFMLSQYGAEESSQYQVLNTIGIRNVSDTQLRWLSSTRLSHLFSTLELFVGWVKEGLYDFSSLPMALKVQLSEDDVATLEKIPAKYPGTPSKLLRELKGLVEVLLHIETHLVKEVNQIAQKPLHDVLDDLSLISEADQLPKLIPKTVLVHHYVKFRMILRRLTSVTEQKVSMETSLQDATDQKQWKEIVDNLWSKTLPHLRDRGFAFIDPTLLMNSSTGQYGFYGDEWEEESDSELGGDLNKDTSEGYSEDGSLQPYSMDYDDPLLYGDSTYYSTLPSVTPSTVPSISPSVRTSETTLVGQSVRETLRQGLEDPEIREEMLKMITKKKVTQDIEEQAKDWSPQMISQFLEGLGKKKHAKTFLEEDINGVELLSADRDVFKDLGVTSCIEYAQIAVLFKRELLGVETIYCSVSELIDSNKKLANHVKALEKAEVDVDMLKFAQDNDFLVDLLKDVGVTKPLDRNRFDAALKTVEESVISPDETLHPDSDQGYVAYSTPV